MRKSGDAVAAMICDGAGVGCDAYLQSINQSISLHPIACCVRFSLVALFGVGYVTLALAAGVISELIGALD